MRLNWMLVRTCKMLKTSVLLFVWPHSYMLERGLGEESVRKHLKDYVREE